MAKHQRPIDGSTCRPSPVRRVGIPKPDGSERELGIPTVVDRLIQQAVLQVLQALIAPTFSQHSHGFRPGRRARDAVLKAQQYVQDGYQIVVDVDLEKFFDRVNHDVLMDRLTKRMADAGVIRLIRAYLNAGGHCSGRLRAGDTVAIWRLDRLGRSLKNLIQLVKRLETANVGLRSVQENIDTTTNWCSTCSTHWPNSSET